MRVVASVVARAPPDAVWAWWTDYGTPGVRHRVRHGFASSSREVLSREGNRVVLRERFPGGFVDHDVVVHDEGRFLEEHYVGGRLWPWPFEATWRFEGADDGRATRVSREVEADVPGPGFLQELGAPALRRLLERDLAAHVAEFEREAGVR